MNIYVSNLGFNLKDEDLRGLFSSYGEVTSAKVINDRETGRSRGFGFVEMSDNVAASAAVSELNETTVEGRTMRVAEALQKEQKRSSFNTQRDYKNRW